ncbi:MAG: hypothetical protein IT288_11935 [Bdellovibrionales bacterium]|nr:hypothetical protein [Bdellovibrionales bacterium]
MNLQDVCPRCHLVIPPERWLERPTICPHCGLVFSRNDEATQHFVNRRFRQIAGVFSVGLVAAFIHIVTWDNHFMTVIPLKAGQLLGLANIQDLVELAKICDLRQNPGCAEASLTDAVRLAPRQLELKEKLGKIRHQMGKHQAAVEVFTAYFNQGGRGLETAFLLAQSLQDLQRREEAAHYYEYILANQPDSLQISVTQKYVHLLSEMGQYSRAIKAIEAVRRRGPSAAYFLDHELKDLKKKLATGRT